MNDFAINVAALSQTRHTCKAYDKTKRIDEQTLQQILEALRLAPSSINIQPWRFLVADNDTAKARIAKSMTDGDTHNVSKVMNASHTLILCTRTTLDDTHLQKILNAEEQAGRFKHLKAKLLALLFAKTIFINTLKTLPNYLIGQSSKLSLPWGICSWWQSWQM